ncbi:hypothetical protein B0J18DRAFT_426809 [Chaetomium sp. MPI-SDFR-AT-0129]|nr:hypothetical protein B0J18DRAFT_426809 [Chaetomium sp. MPI-SDFR-AT-0129]
MTSTTNVLLRQPGSVTQVAPEPYTATISREQVLVLLKTTAVGQRDFILVDTRQKDVEAGTIRGSIHLQAESLPITLPSVYALFKAAGLRLVIFYCGTSVNRGRKAAEHLTGHITRVGDRNMKSLVLEGGFKGWAAAGEEYVRWVDAVDVSSS